MKSLAALLLAAIASAPLAAAERVLDVEFRTLAGKEKINLAERFGGQVLLVVNTASKCGFTPQYEGLEALHQELNDRGFSVVGFPSNDFKGQEPGSEQEIQEFCTLTYGVKFPMFEKVHVTGEEATPFYKQLASATGQAPGWNFHKYLIDRHGRVVASYGSRVTPDNAELRAAIETLLAAPVPRPMSGS